MAFNPAAHSWIVGYPQSGNSWLAFLIAGLLGHTPTSWEQGKMLIPNWDKVACGDCIAPIGWTRAHMPFDQWVFKDVQKIIYIIRHPFDIMLSSYRYRRQYHDYDKGLDHYIDRFTYWHGEPENGLVGMGTWNTNAQSWLNAMHGGVILVQYEGLWQNPTACLREIAPTATDHQIVNAVNGAGIDRMRKLDTQDFVGQGGFGQWKDIMTEQQIRKGVIAFGATMDMAGYTDLWLDVEKPER